MTYSNEKYGTIDNFIRSDDFAPFKQEYTDVLDSIAAFVYEHASRLSPPLLNETCNDVKADFEVLKEHLFNLQTDYFRSHKPIVYGTTKEMFHEFNRMLRNENINLQQRMDAVRALATKAPVCSGGMGTELQEAIMALKIANRGLKGASQQWKINKLNALILQHVQDNHEYMPEEEVHFVNVYYNFFADAMGVAQRQDAYVRTYQDEIDPDQLAKCKEHVLAGLKPTGLAATLRCRSSKSALSLSMSIAY